MDTVFFWISKIAWITLSPFNLLLILLIGIWILLWRGSKRIAKLLLGYIVIVLIIVALFPVGDWLIYPLESRFVTNPDLPETIDGIIVLSGAENATLSSHWNQVELGDAAERNIAFLKLARQYPNANLVFTGGSSSLLNQEYMAADVAKILFQDLGLDVSRVTFERNARNTYENAVFSLELVKPDLNDKWILITTSWHMPRSVGIFCKIGWKVIPYPVDHMINIDNLFGIEFSLSGHLNVLETAIHEWMGLFIYYITGKTSGLFPGRCK